MHEAGSASGVSSSSRLSITKPQNRATISAVLLNQNKQIRTQSERHKNDFPVMVLNAICFVLLSACMAEHHLSFLTAHNIFSEQTFLSSGFGRGGNWPQSRPFRLLASGVFMVKHDCKKPA